MVTLIHGLVHEEEENMAMIQQFGMHNNVHLEENENKGENNHSNRDTKAGNSKVTKLNAINNTKDSNLQEQVYISLQSPSREDNPISSFAKPPDFISLKPLTLDEENAILMQVKYWLLELFTKIKFSNLIL